MKTAWGDSELTKSAKNIKKPYVLVIDGEIGAGKTTLIAKLKAKFEKLGHKTAVIPEPVDEWKKVGILQEFYEDKTPERRGLVAYDFQTYTFVTRVRKMIEVVEAEPDADIYILERSVLTDRFIFMELQRKMVGKRRMIMYDAWWEMWVRIVPFPPTKFVYLKPTLKNCMSRVATRARDGEVLSSEKEDKEASARGGVSLAYQRRLRHAHESYLQGLHMDDFPDMPKRPFDIKKDVIVVEGELADADFTKAGKALDQIVAHIVKKALPEL